MTTSGNDMGIADNTCIGWLWELFSCVSRDTASATVFGLLTCGGTPLLVRIMEGHLL